jgi:hypothetical protein
MQKGKLRGPRIGPSTGRTPATTSGAAAVLAPYRIRRINRKLARRKGGRLNRITVFMRYENVVRLLEFLRYCLE